MQLEKRKHALLHDFALLLLLLFLSIHVILIWCKACVRTLTLTVKSSRSKSVLRFFQYLFVVDFIDFQVYWSVKIFAAMVCEHNVCTFRWKFEVCISWFTKSPAEFNSGMVSIFSHPPSFITGLKYRAHEFSLAAKTFQVMKIHEKK